MKVCVVGAGHSGLAMAGHIASLGHEVTLFNRTEQRLSPITHAGNVIELRELLSGSHKLHTVTSNLAAALRGQQLIMVAIPASGHASLAKAAAPYLRAGQVVVLNPGRTLGALEFTVTLERHGCRGVVVAETQTILYTSRAEGNIATVAALKNSVLVAALPATETPYVLSYLRRLYPQVKAARNTIETSLGNVGMVLHPIPMIMNAGWIEFPDSTFRYYYDAISTSIAGVLERLDMERLQVAESLGEHVMSIRKWLDSSYGVDRGSLYESIQAISPYEIVTAPKTLNHRYIVEDIETGLVPLSELGKLTGVSTPISESAIQMASSLLSRDFRASGRTAVKLGLADAGSPSEIRRRILLEQ